MPRTKTTKNFRFEFMKPNDARLTSVLSDLVSWYLDRYGDLEGYDAWGEVHNDMNTQFTKANRGVFLAMFDGETIVATGAARRCDDETAEFKKFWSHPERRGEGLASILLAQLETEARRLGYRKVYLTTGPRQHEADRLYQRNGFTPHFDPARATPHIYTKALVPGVDATVLPDQAAGVLMDYGDRVKSKLKAPRQ